MIYHISCLATSIIFVIDHDFHNYIIGRIFQSAATVKVCYPSNSILNEYSSSCNFQYIGTLYTYSSSILKIWHSSKEFDASSNQSPIENINACSAQSFSRILKTSATAGLEIKWKSGLFKPQTFVWRLDRKTFKFLRLFLEIKNGKKTFRLSAGSIFLFFHLHGTCLLSTDVRFEKV